MKRVTILGSTGSIGTQALSVIRDNPERFRISGLACGRNIERLKEQILEFRPQFAVCASEDDRADLAAWADLEGISIETLSGEEGVIEAAERDCDIILNSVMGVRGLLPTYHAIKAGHDIAIANKETLVAGGSVIMSLVKRSGVRFLPVDSEHSAIFQCLEGNRDKEIKKILLTASGGPFRGFTKEQLSRVTAKDALKHPNWTMGQKITIDSATMMNKGLEIIEARWLFDVPLEKIQVLVHPQSIVHSAVEFCDNAVLAQLGTPDMKVPISVALGYPDRLPDPGEELDFFGKGRELTFEEPDEETFGCLALAKEALRLGGTYPAAMNGANEVLVEAFLKGRIGFTDICSINEEVLSAHSSVSEPDLDEILEADLLARKAATDIMERTIAR